MEDIKTIQLKADVLEENDIRADEVRELMKKNGTKLINLMASPGAGKTSLILQMIKKLDDIKTGVVEGDIDSLVDSMKVKKADVPVVQIQTGGACHLDAEMIEPALEEIEKEEKCDLIIVENIGNLVCPAEFDIGADLRMMVLSIPEGDDKVLKYPLMFSVCDICVINKIDYKPLSDFDTEAFYERFRRINPEAKIFEVSCKTGEGIDELCEYIHSKVKE